LKDTARKHDLEKHIKYKHMVQSATWDEENGVWNLVIEGPDGIIEDQCEILVNGSGILKYVISILEPPLANIWDKRMEISRYSWDRIIHWQTDA
jgi:cation diffusion facilitator CzcD-associated flavoprotein CzcO